jgi:hypothetical protein
LQDLLERNTVFFLGFASLLNKHCESTVQIIYDFLLYLEYKQESIDFTPKNQIEESIFEGTILNQESVDNENCIV